ncbi:hypothetical protein [Gluconobacter kondonii]|uniref:hypothetical protein n=1 Tax=Gluconobacter kondonii TaxID=941463 RepID=UPI00197FFBEA|nr:hypothetical protein [Gluconobacter kondonii]MBN3867481.1 hypothetical protein [Gluconobacter kondonii]
MTDFRERADDFLAEEKHVAGLPEYRRSQLNDGFDLIWLIGDASGVTRNRVHIKTYDGSPHAFVVMVQMWWEPSGREIPIFRLMMTPPKEPHPNRPPLPPGISEMTVIGPRYYTWNDNRQAFRVGMPGLPYAISLPRNLEDFHNAIRYVCGECGIGLSAAELPDFPGKGRLL